MIRIFMLCAALLLVGCDPAPPEETSRAVDEPAPDASAATSPAPDESASARLETVLARMPETVQQRYRYRHPKETLEFFGIEPGMTVVEALPGGGWYTRILLPYLGPEGRLIGANYPRDMWPMFGIFDQEYIDRMQTWVEDFPEQARAWQGQDGAAVDAFELGSLPESMEGQADAVLLIRALHNLARFDGEGGFLTAALDDVNRVLKPGGVVGVVQHEARPDMPDEWAGGNAGYLKKQFVIDRMEQAGLELVEESDINANPDDQPTTDDVVWRLPPSYATSGDDAERRSEVDAIGESHRMTLKFVKPQ